MLADILTRLFLDRDERRNRTHVFECSPIFHLIEALKVLFLLHPGTESCPAPSPFPASKLSRRILTVMSQIAGRGSSIGCASAWYVDGCVFDPHDRRTFFKSWRFGHEKHSTAILSLPLIQEGQLSTNGERMC